MKKEKSFGNKDFKLYFGQAMTLVPSDEGIKVGVKQLLTASDVAQLRQTVVKYLAEEDRIPTHVYLDEVGVGDQGVGHVRLKKAVREQFRVIVTSVSSKEAYTPNGFGKPLCTGIGDKASGVFSNKPTQGHPGQKEVLKDVVETAVKADTPTIHGQIANLIKILETEDAAKNIFKPKTTAMERVQIGRLAYNIAAAYMKENGVVVPSWKEARFTVLSSVEAGKELGVFGPIETVAAIEMSLARGDSATDVVLSMEAGKLEGKVGYFDLFIENTHKLNTEALVVANRLYVGAVVAMLGVGGRYESESKSESRTPSALAFKNAPTSGPSLTTVFDEAACPNCNTLLSLKATAMEGVSGRIEIRTPEPAKEYACPHPITKCHTTNTYNNSVLPNTDKWECSVCGAKPVPSSE